MAAATPVDLVRSKSTPQAEVFIGRAHWGKYQLSLWDQNGNNPRVIGEGVHVDEIPDRYRLGERVEELHQCIFGWYIVVAAHESQPGEQYYVKVTITQDGASVHTREYRDDLSKPVIFEGVKFLVQ